MSLRAAAEERARASGCLRETKRSIAEERWQERGDAVLKSLVGAGVVVVGGGGGGGGGDGGGGGGGGGEGMLRQARGEKLKPLRKSENRKLVLILGAGRKDVLMDAYKTGFCFDL